MGISPQAARGARKRIVGSKLPYGKRMLTGRPLSIFRRRHLRAGCRVRITGDTSLLYFRYIQARKPQSQ
ncbi:hypothetical protein J6590_046538 [Homalodisca vitripennis]|nr:hypothetical protein J6590_046538 [Homalodisca vitripennis]